MRARRIGKGWWATRLIGRHAAQWASVRAGALMTRLLPLGLQHRAACWAFATLAPMLRSARRRRAARTLQQLGLPATTAARFSAYFLAHDWLRRARMHAVQALPFPALRQHLRSIAWHDPHALWPAGAGRRRVICLLRTGDLELAAAAVLDRPGAPAHYFIQCTHAPGSPPHRTLLALQRQGHRLDIGTCAQRGAAWRQLQRGASIITVLDTVVPAAAGCPAATDPGPLRLARLAGVPVLLLAHRRDNAKAGTLHVLGEFNGDALAHGAHRVHEAAQAFLAASPLDWLDLDQ